MSALTYGSCKEGKRYVMETCNSQYLSWRISCLALSVSSGALVRVLPVSRCSKVMLLCGKIGSRAFLQDDKYTSVRKHLCRPSAGMEEHVSPNML